VYVRSDVAKNQVRATEIRSIAEHIRRVTLDARRLALGLAPIAVERAGLAGALALVKLDMETLGGPTLAISIEGCFSRKLPLYMAVNLYRIAQEATANAMRHSGASHVHIWAEVCEEGLLRIPCRGDGFKSSQTLTPAPLRASSSASKT